MKCELELLKVRFAGYNKKMNRLVLKFMTQKEETEDLLGLLVEKFC